MLLRALAVSLAIAAPAVAQLSPIVALWALDEQSGTVVNDTGPYQNQGTLVNFGASPWGPAQFGNGLTFDGTDDYVLITPVGDLPVYPLGAAPFSITFWVNAPPQSDRRVYSEQAAVTSGVGPLFTLGSGSTAAGATGRLRVFVRTDDARICADILSAGAVFDNSWHHVTYVDDIGRVRIYVDGVLDTVADYSRWSYGPASTLPGSYQLIDSVTLGAVVRNGTVSAPMAGTLDDVQVYRAALTASDALAIFNGAAPNLVAGSLGVFGQGCGPGPMDMVATGSASLGGTAWLQMVRGTPNGVLLFGLSAGVATPAPLGAFGYPGCTLYLPTLDLGFAGVVEPSGSAPALPIAVPSTPTLNGAFFTAQWISVLPSTFELSPAATLQIGF